MATVKRITPLPPPEPEPQPMPTPDDGVAVPGGMAITEPPPPEEEGELYIDPTVESLLPWGPLEDYTAAKGRKMKIRRALDIGGHEEFWKTRKKNEDLMRVNGVRVWARKGPDNVELKNGVGGRIWDATWYVPTLKGHGERSAAPKPPKRPSAPSTTNPGGDFVHAVAALMKRLSTTKAVEFPEYQRIHEMLRAPVTPALEEI